MAWSPEVKSSGAATETLFRKTQNPQTERTEKAALFVLQNTQPNTKQPLGTNRNITIA